MSPGRLNDLPKVTQLVPDFVLIVLPPKQVQMHFTPPAYPLRVWGLVKVSAAFRGASLESGEVGRRRVSG